MSSHSPQRKLLVQTSHYSFGSLLTMVAGLVSFPLLTRVLTIADYGVLSLIGATVSIAAAFGKVGIQHSIVRYQSEISAGKGEYRPEQLQATTFFGMAASALVVTLVMMVASQLVPARWLGGTASRWLFAFASLMILMQVIESTMTNFLRAEQRTTTLMAWHWWSACCCWSRTAWRRSIARAWCPTCSG